MSVIIVVTWISTSTKPGNKNFISLPTVCMTTNLCHVLGNVPGLAVGLTVAPVDGFAVDAFVAAPVGSKKAHTLVIQKTKCALPCLKHASVP